MFCQPFDFEAEITNKGFQVESIEQQSNELYKSKLGAISTSVIEFYKTYIDKNKISQNLIGHTKNLFVCFEVHTCVNSYFWKWNKSKVKSDQN